MLQTQTVEPGTLSVLREFLEIQDVGNFHLVGGTALALLFGHRLSVDLDLFCPDEFDNEFISEVLTKQFGSRFVIRHSVKNMGIFGFIDNIKVDLVRHPHPLLRPIQIIDGIRMFSAEDIIAMKVQAILQRARKKDFWDVAELLNHFTVLDFAKLHQQKYSKQILMISVPQAITYFVDAEGDDDPKSLKGQTWEKIKSTIRKKVETFLK